MATVAGHISAVTVSLPLLLPFALVGDFSPAQRVAGKCPTRSSCTLGSHPPCAMQLSSAAAAAVPPRGGSCPACPARAGAAWTGSRDDVHTAYLPPLPAGNLSETCRDNHGASKHFVAHVPRCHCCCCLQCGQHIDPQREYGSLHQCWGLLSKGTSGHAVPSTRRSGHPPRMHLYLQQRPHSYRRCWGHTSPWRGEYLH